MIKRLILFYCLANTCLSFAEPLNDENLKIYGRSLANYQVCAQIAGELDDKAMRSYYSEMFTDSYAEIKAYSQELFQIIVKEFDRSVDKLAEIDKQSMATLCSSRFDALSRKMLEKKLAGK